jgi:hypothetical protein
VLRPWSERAIIINAALNPRTADIVEQIDA